MLITFANSLDPDKKSGLKSKITHDSPVLYDLGDVISETVAFMEDSLMVLGSLLSNR